MEIHDNKLYKSHGTGEFTVDQFRKIGKDVIFERGVLVFHPENIIIGNNVYVGHNTMLKGYYKNTMEFEGNNWIGQGCFLHSAGGIYLGRHAGLGPFVKILTHQHVEEEIEKPISCCKQEFKKVVIEEAVEVGLGAIILPGVTIGKYSLIGAGAVVTKDVEPYSVMMGVPAKLIRKRK
ncbi:MAG: acyltransferase [Candidatus Omnitrophota bacterium]